MSPAHSQQGSPLPQAPLLLCAKKLWGSYLCASKTPKGPAVTNYPH